MSKKILLTGASLVALSFAIYAGPKFDRQSDSISLVRLQESTFLGEKNSGLSEQMPMPHSFHEKPLTQSLTDSIVYLRPEKTERPEVSKSESTRSPTVAGFTIDQALEYGKLAQMAYVDIGNPEGDKNTFAQIERLQAEGNRVQFFGTEAENSGLIVTHRDGRVSVFYKGTDSLRNLATDARGNFAIDDNTGLRCHNGIMKGFYRTQPQVFAILQQIADARGKSIEALLQDDVTVGGHSLGGGLALMFKGFSIKKHNATPKAITFGTPRTLDIATNREINAPSHNRYANVMQVGDPVTGIALGFLGYEHGGTRLHVPNVKDKSLHVMDAYIQALEAMAQNGEIRVGTTVFKYEESTRTGIGKAKWIGNTIIPNPLYPIHKARAVIAEHVDPVIHKAVKTVKDGVISLAIGVGSTAKKAAETVGTAAKKVANTISDAAKSVWNFFKK